MRTVLVTQRLAEETAYPEVREALDARWGRFFRALDLLPVPMSQEIDPSEYVALDPALVVLTGGNDVAAVTTSKLSHQRDVYERRVLAVADAHGWPIFAVCRGLQLLSVDAGATLHEVSDHVACEHGLTAVPGAPFAPLLGNVHRVNSFHRWAPAGALRGGWMVSAHGDDGGIEAIAHDSRRALAVMWHPERYDTPRPCDLALVRAVVAS